MLGCNDAGRRSGGPVFWLPMRLRCATGALSQSREPEAVIGCNSVPRQALLFSVSVPSWNGLAGPPRLTTNLEMRNALMELGRRVFLDRFTNKSEPQWAEEGTWSKVPAVAHE
jgi:hypothetical protein